MTVASGIERFSFIDASFLVAQVDGAIQHQRTDSGRGGGGSRSLAADFEQFEAERLDLGEHA
jgi:hypothetical protein